MINVEAYADQSYTLDAQNRIIATGPNWDMFALENGGAMACSAQVLQRNVLDFVTGGEVKMLFGNLLKSVREHQRTMRVPFRCDAPTRRRFMMLSVSPEEQQRLTVRTQLAQAIDRPASDTLPEGLEARKVIQLCAWCNRIKQGEEWLDLEQGISHFGLFCQPDVPPLTHGICEDCVRMLEAEMPKDLSPEQR